MQYVFKETNRNITASRVSIIALSLIMMADLGLCYHNVPGAKYKSNAFHLSSRQGGNQQRAATEI